MGKNMTKEEELTRILDLDEKVRKFEIMVRADAKKVRAMNKELGQLRVAFINKWANEEV